MTTPLDAALAADCNAVIGFGVGGLEVDRTPFTEVFARARAAGLHSMPHAGETSGPESVWVVPDVEPAYSGGGLARRASDAAASRGRNADHRRL